MSVSSVSCEKYIYGVFLLIILTQYIWQIYIMKLIAGFKKWFKYCTIWHLTLLYCLTFSSYEFRQRHVFLRRKENLSLMVANFARRIVVCPFVGFYVYCNWWGNWDYADCCVFLRRIFRWKRGKFLSFFGKRALTITNQFPPSENPIELKKNFIPFLKIRRAHILVF